MSPLVAPQNIDQDFDSEFFTGTVAAGSSLVPDVLQVALGGHAYAIDPKKFQRATVPLRRESTDESVEPGEQCADEETEILTSRGWLRHGDLLVGDEALTLNMDTGLSEWHPVEDISRYHRASFPMWSMEGRGHSSLTTLNHRWPVLNDAVKAIHIRLSEELLPGDSLILPGGTQDVGDLKCDKVFYNGVVWCPTTKTQTWCARRNGHVYFTGNTLNTGGAWRRSQDNWFMGAGQEYLDNRFAFVSVYTNSGEDPSVRTKFWRSKGVDPWTEGGLSLLPEQAQKGASAGAAQLLEAVGTYLFWWDGTNLKVSTNPGAGSPTWTTITAPLSLGAWPNVYGMTTDGANLYLALDTYGIGMVASGAATATIMRPTMAAPTLTVTGTPGTTSYSYFVVPVDANGFRGMPSPAGTTATGPASLAAGDAIIVKWAPVQGAVTYDVLKTDTAHSVATGVTQLSFTDDGSNSSAAYTTPTTTTQNPQATFVSYGNGFLLAGAGPLLAQVDASGMTTLVMKHFNPNFVWNTGCGAPQCIYVAGNAVGKSELYAIQLSTTTFGLNAPYIAGAVGDGEIINDLCYYQGIVAVSTSVGVRSAQDSGNSGFLTMGAVIDALGASQCCAPYGNHVWFGISNFAEDDGIYGGTAVSSGLGRLFLSEFSAPLIPAYTSDILATNGTSGTTVAVAIYQGTPFFAIAGNGVWGPSGNLVSYGYLEAGWVRYGTVEDKILVSTDVRHDGLPAGAEVTVDIVPFNGSSFTALISTQQGGIGPDGPVSAGNPTGEAFHVVVQLNRGTTPTQGPVLRRWTTRAIIVAARQDEIIVPIIWADEEQTPVGDGSGHPLDLVAEWQYLKGLETSGQAFIYQQGALTDIAFIDQIVQEESTGWNDTKAMLQGTLMVKLLTVA